MIVDPDALRPCAGPAPGTSFIQLCFVVEDLQAAMEGFTRALGAGPWFVADSPPPAADRTLYRGGPAPLRTRFALGYAGDTMLELVRPEPGSRSIFREWADGRGYGLHHLGFAAEDFDAAVSHLRRGGSAPLTESVTPRGARIAMFEPLPHGIALHELIEMLPANRAFYRFMRDEAARWDRRSLVFEGAVPAAAS